MNKIIIIARFFVNDNGREEFVYRLFVGDYEEEVRDNVNKFWHKHLPFHKMSLRVIPHYDELNSAHITTFFK
jgi:hypothetical protein